MNPTTNNNTTNNNNNLELNQTNDLLNSTETLSLSLSGVMPLPLPLPAAPPLPPQPPQMVTVVPIDKDAPSSDNWYHGRLERLASEERLKQAKLPSAFLLRESERNSGSFVLSYLSLRSDVYHFKVITPQDYFYPFKIIFLIVKINEFFHYFQYISLTKNVSTKKYHAILKISIGLFKTYFFEFDIQFRDLSPFNVN
jgi:hypothetical protein